MHQPYLVTRRQMLIQSLLGLGALGTGGLGGLAPLPKARAELANPLAPKAPHFAPRAKQVIFFFMTGGASHVDSFDPKEKLYAADGKSFNDQELMGSPWQAQPRGESGIHVTNLFPHIGGVMDDICLIRSLHGDKGDHFEATLHMHTGSKGSALPSIGAWVSYGLGTFNSNLPAHIVFAENTPYAGSQVWSSNFLPAYHQGTRVVPGDEPIPHLKPKPDSKGKFQEMELDMLRQLNSRHRKQFPQDTELSARMLTFKTAYSMQRIAPDLFDLRQERDHTLDMYGVKRGDNQSFGWQCLMARRMVESGVRFVELIDTGSSGNWDAHGNINSHAPLAKQIDKPIAGLLKDLKQRGMLDETLVVWCTEFGRTPWATGGGRGHHNDAFSCWLAGGGVKGGHVHGATDEVGAQVAEDPVHVHDFHATILHLLGLDHKQLTYRHAGRDFRLTDVHGNVVEDLLA